MSNVATKTTILREGGFFIFIMECPDSWVA